MGNVQTEPSAAPGGQAGPPASGGNTDMASIRKMDTLLRKRLRSGVQYNMKVVVRGAKGSGKTALWQRLQGLPFSAKYESTPEIRTTTINWSCPSGDEAVKVEVWDVVDKGFAADDCIWETLEDRLAGLPSNGGSSSYLAGVAGSSRSFAAVLDATVVDVYKGAQAAIVMLDPRDVASLTYLTDTLAELPSDVSVVALLNFKDLAAAAAAPTTPRDNPSGGNSGGSGGGSCIPAMAVTLADVEEVFAAKRESDAASGVTRQFAAFETSMLDCFGLRVLYNYLNLPFLELKRRSLLQQAQRAEEELALAAKDLGAMVSAHSYSEYIAQLRSTRADPTAGRASPSVSRANAVAAVAAAAASPSAASLRSDVGAPSPVANDGGGDNTAAALDTSERQDKGKRRSHHKHDKNGEREGGGERSSRRRERNAKDGAAAAAAAPSGSGDEAAAGKHKHRHKHHRHRSGKKEGETVESAAGAGGVAVEADAVAAAASLDAVATPQDYVPAKVTKSELDAFFADGDSDEGASNPPTGQRSEQRRHLEAYVKPTAAAKTSPAARHASNGAASADRDQDDDMPRFSRLKKASLVAAAAALRPPKAQPLGAPLPVEASSAAAPAAAKLNGDAATERNLAAAEPKPAEAGGSAAEGAAASPATAELAEDRTLKEDAQQLPEEELGQAGGREAQTLEAEGKEEEEGPAGKEDVAVSVAAAAAPATPAPAAAASSNVTLPKADPELTAEPAAGEVEAAGAAEPASEAGERCGGVPETASAAAEEERPEIDRGDDSGALNTDPLDAAGIAPAVEHCDVAVQEDASVSLGKEEERAPDGGKAATGSDLEASQAPAVDDDVKAGEAAAAENEDGEAAPGATNPEPASDADANGFGGHERSLAAEHVAASSHNTGDDDGEGGDSAGEAAAPLQAPGAEEPDIVSFVPDEGKDTKALDSSFYDEGDESDTVSSDRAEQESASNRAPPVYESKTRGPALSSRNLKSGSVEARTADASGLSAAAQAAVQAALAQAALEAEELESARKARKGKAKRERTGSRDSRRSTASK